LKNNTLNLHVNSYLWQEGNKLRRFVRFFGVLSLVLAFSLSIGGLSPAPASPLLFDRGLPTINLNNADLLRSNVSWADGYYTAPPTSYNAPGDDFTIGSIGGTYHLDRITLWTVDDPPFDYRLLGGLPGAISEVPTTSVSVSAITYGSGELYQGNTASYPIYQVDFTVDWTVAGGQLYQFFIDAPLHNYGTPDAPAYATPFLHASNAALSGSPQQGADDRFLWLTLTDGVPGSVTSWDSNLPGVWDKSSDANVQIYGTPLPGTLLLLGSGLAALGLWRGRKRFKS
jgi:hypothetical protein